MFPLPSATPAVRPAVPTTPLPSSTAVVASNSSAHSGGRGKKLPRKRKRWTKDEEGFLWAGVQKHGVGAWAVILADSEYSFNPQRTAVDLKDKWRVLTVRRPPTAPPPPIDPASLPRAPPTNKRAREASPERTYRTVAVAATPYTTTDSQSSPILTSATSSSVRRASQPESRNQSQAVAEEEARGRSRSRSLSLSTLPSPSVWSSIQSDWFASFSALPPPDAWLTGPACSLLPEDLRSASVDPFPPTVAATPTPALFSGLQISHDSPADTSFPRIAFEQPTQPTSQSFAPETLASPSLSSCTEPAPSCPVASRLATLRSSAIPDPAFTLLDLTHEFEYHDYSADESEDDSQSNKDNEWSIPAMAHGESLFPFTSSPMDGPGVDRYPPFSAVAAAAASHSSMTSVHSPTSSSDLVPRNALQPMVWNPARFFGAFNPPPPALRSAPAPARPPTDTRATLKAELTDAITRARIAGDELKAHHESIVLKLMMSSGRSVQHAPQADLFNCRHHPKVDHRVTPRLRPGALAWRPRSVSPISSPRVRPVNARPLARAVVTANDPVHAAMAKASTSNKKRGRSEPAPVARMKFGGAARPRVLERGNPEDGDGGGNALIPHAISEATDLALAEMLDAALQLDESTRTAALRLLGNRAFARNSSRLESLAFRALRLTATDILRMDMNPSEASLPDDPVAAAAAVKPSEYMYARIKKGHSHMQTRLLQVAAANGTRALTK